MSLLLIAAFLFYSGVNAQIFTRQDSLRGYLFPERTAYDVYYYHLDVKVNPKDSTLSGFNDIYYEVMEPFERIQVDLFENMNISKVSFNNKELKFTREGNAFFIDFPEKQKKGEQGKIRIYYSGKPIISTRAPWDGGFVWHKDNKGKNWIGVAVQGTGASAFWPNKDHLSDEPDSVLISCSVPNGLQCISNGRFRSKSADGKDFTKYNWFVSNPINNYNVSLNIADYAHFSDTFVSKIDGQKLSLDYYVLPYNLDKAKEHFKQVKLVLDCLEGFWGKYPFYEDGFKMIETPYLGMEHQSAISYGNQYKKGYMGMDMTGLGYDYIIYHEIGHEWFGNNISMKDIADMWIHEGFTSYSDALFLECMAGKEASIQNLNRSRNQVHNKRPVVGPKGVNYENMTDSDKYNKGALLLNTLRTVIDDDKLWFAMLKDMNTTFRHSTVETADIVNYFNQKSGKDLTTIFEQYLYHPKLPVLEYQLIQKGKDTEVKYRWRANVKDFNMPVRMKSGEKVFWLEPKEDLETKMIKNISPEEIGVDNMHFYINSKLITE